MALTTTMLVPLVMSTHACDADMTLKVLSTSFRDTVCDAPVQGSAYGGAPKSCRKLS